MNLHKLFAGATRLLAPLTFGATALADVVYVDATGNGQFTAIQPAINAAVDGDVLLVRSGSYGGFTIDNRQLWIVADPGAAPKITTQVIVRNTASNKAVLLSGLEIAFSVASFPIIGVRVENNPGHVRFEGCTLRGSTGGPTPVDGGAGASMLNSPKVAFVGCSLLGGNGGGVPLFVTLGGRGGVGAVTQGSVVAFYDCLLKGGVGGAADYVGPSDRAGDGGDGCRVIDFGILASGSQFQGGMGGGSSTIPGNGGNGLRVDNGQAQYIGSTFAGGLGGVSYFGTIGATGQPQTGTGVFNQIAGSARRLTAPALAAEGSTIQVQLSGEPGDRFWLLKTRLPDFVYAPASAGVRLVLAMAFTSLQPQAILGPSGTASVQVFVPELSTGTAVARQYWQAVVLSASGQVRLGSARHVAVLNCSDLLPDCNGNGSCDSCDLLAPNVADCDKNGVPDSCQPDCNGNGIADSCDIANGLSGDANHNTIPDECEPHSTWYVDSTAAAGGNGTPGAPYQTMSQAFAAASSGDTLILAPGTYVGSGNRNLDFAGRALIVQSSGSANDTFLDCQGQGRVFMLNTGVPPGARIERLKFLNGAAPNQGDGGAIFVLDCSPTIRDCEFQNCQGPLGGAIRITNSNARIEHCTFLANTSPAYGGAINSSNGAPRCVDCLFVGNHGQTGGGAIGINNTSWRIERCIFIGNSANVGGALKGFGDIKLDQCVFAGNVAQYGGGLQHESGSLAVSSCTFVDNSAVHAGALYFTSPYSSLRTVRNSVIWSNPTSAGTPIEVPQGPLDFAWNDLQGGQAAITVGAQGSLVFGPGNLSLDPRFVDPDGPDNQASTIGDNDYRLMLASPCLDAGDNSSVAPDGCDLDSDGNVSEPVPFDLDGNARFVEIPSAPNTGNGTPPLVDMGAWERP